MACTFSDLGKLGRLGNSLFQISAVIGYARQYNMDYVLPVWNYSKHFKYGFNQATNIPAMARFTEKTFHYTKIPRYKNVDLYGYFQSKRYWQHCENEIRKMWQPNDAIQEILNKNRLADALRKTCAIHVRRTDYLQLNQYHPSLPIDYYKNAIEAMKADTYTVFSDEIEWCKQEPTFAGENFTFINSGNDILDWFMMRAHDNFIIANSSFSWWASYLGENEEKRIIAPSKDKWFGTQYKHNNVDDLYLPEWELI